LWRCVTLAVLIEPFRVEISRAAVDAERRQAMSYNISIFQTQRDAMEHIGGVQSLRSMNTLSRVAAK
jgi:hypothetical protein